MSRPVDTMPETDIAIAIHFDNIAVELRKLGQGDIADRLTDLGTKVCLLKEQS